LRYYFFGFRFHFLFFALNNNCPLVRLEQKRQAAGSSSGLFFAAARTNFFL
jgi:hypothetical protein